MCITARARVNVDLKILGSSDVISGHDSAYQIAYFNVFVPLGGHINQNWRSDLHSAGQHLYDARVFQCFWEQGVAFVLECVRNRAANRGCP